MAVGSGVGSQVGFAAESSWGTFVAPAKWLLADSFGVKKVKNTQQASGVAAGRLVPLAVHSVVTTKGAAGPVGLTVMNKGMGVILNTLFGGTVSPTQQASTTAYLQTHSLSDPVGKSMTMQAGIADAGGTVRDYSYVGCKVLSAEVSCEINGLLKMSLDIDAKDVDEAQTLGTPSYPTTTAPFHGGQLDVKIHGTYGSEAHVDGVKSVSVTLARPMDTERYYAGASGLKAQPIINDWAVMEGSLGVDFVTQADFADRFAAHTTFAMVWEWVGPTIEDTYKETFRLKFPACKLTGDTPTIDGPGVNTGSFPFQVLYDGTNAPVICEYISTDSAL